MKKRTLKFTCLIEMATFSKLIAVGYLMNTNNFTLTANLSDTDVTLALEKYNAMLIETTDKVFSYEAI